MDAFGKASLDYLKNEHDEFIDVESKTMEDDVIPVAHLFRSFEDMPAVEQKALAQVKGKVLDVGGGVGSHSIWLQEQNLKCTLIDICEGLCEVAKTRGVHSVIYGDFFEMNEEEKFDSLIFMMNGIGIGGDFETFKLTLEKARKLLNPGGEIIFDSTDISFCYAQEDGSMLLPLNLPYFGFVEFRLKYKNETDNWFNWAYYDHEKLRSLLPNDLELEIIHDESPAYSGKITGF